MIDQSKRVCGIIEEGKVCLKSTDHMHRKVKPQWFYPAEYVESCLEVKKE